MIRRLRRYKSRVALLALIALGLGVSLGLWWVADLATQHGDVSTINT